MMLHSCEQNSTVFDEKNRLGTFHSETLTFQLTNFGFTNFRKIHTMNELVSKQNQLLE